jgi:hypothetical protein
LGGSLHESAPEIKLRKSRVRPTLQLQKVRAKAIIMNRQQC